MNENLSNLIFVNVTASNVTAILIDPAGTLHSDELTHLYTFYIVTLCTFLSLIPYPEHDQWTEKYRPKRVKDIIGQQGDRSNVKKLLNWLKVPLKASNEGNSLFISIINIFSQISWEH